MNLHRSNSITLLIVSPLGLHTAEQKSGIKEKRKKAASFQTVSQLHKVTDQEPTQEPIQEPIQEPTQEPIQGLELLPQLSCETLEASPGELRDGGS